ncbi:MAG TPA: glycosyltransferase [Anaerolineae bacterium]|nr:glycosyltransferase [Anaerolineae bacterium]HQM12924.1 glycosyltransferase [Anaerolineae bacterium]
MSTPGFISGEIYDAYYYMHGCGIPYERTDSWLQAFGNIADCIIRDINPNTVLDAGCALGLLVESLRRREVEAYGIDISEYAIRHVHPEFRPYCWVGSITEPFPRKYDLIVSIEVVEHMLPEQAEAAIANLCQHSDDVLFSSSPLDYKEITHFNVHPLEYWGMLFAKHGFYRDVDFDASFITPWAIRFRKASDPLYRVVGSYERRMWHLLQESKATRDINLELRQSLADKEHEIRELQASVVRSEKRWEHLEDSAGWKIMLALQNCRAVVLPPASLRDRIFQTFWLGLRDRNIRKLVEIPKLIKADFLAKLQRRRWNRRLGRMQVVGKVLLIPEVHLREIAYTHFRDVDIIVYVHDRLNEVQSCLLSLFKYTNQPYSLILIDDGSNVETRDYLIEFSAQYGARVIHTHQTQGYVATISQLLQDSVAAYVVALDGDVIVTGGWLDRMVACAESDPTIGIVAPLTNHGAWQSIPEAELNGTFVANRLPDTMAVDEMGALLADYSCRLYPPMPLLDHFCFMVKRDLIGRLGGLDTSINEGNLALNEYIFRARRAGWKTVLADDVYLYHIDFQNYFDKKKLYNTILASKYGTELITQAVAFCQNSLTLEGIRARSRTILARHELLEIGRQSYSGRKVLFILPITEPGGGANVIIDEVYAMRKMGVDAQIFNKTAFREKFERSYPDMQIPVIYGDHECLGVMAADYDAVIASVYFTVDWLKPLLMLNSPPVLGYYVQGFEPYIYEVGTLEYEQALESYTLITGLRLFTKTAWTRDEVKAHTGAKCALVGVSINTDLFCPRPFSEVTWPDRPLRIAAMIRPNTLYRGPRLTMEILQRAALMYGDEVQVMIFGTELADPAFGALPNDFPWLLAGVLTQKQVAHFFNEVDIFVDFSSHQAMGLAALEAMSSGVAVIVPEYGGAQTYARHEYNSLVVNTNSPEECWQALQRLIKDHELRDRLRRQAVHDVASLFPERSALEILKVLFG